MNAAKKRVGLYLNPGVIVRNPGYLELLQREIGLNLLIIIYTGELSPEVLAPDPLRQHPALS